MLGEIPVPVVPAPPVAAPVPVAAPETDDSGALTDDDAMPLGTAAVLLTL